MWADHTLRLESDPRVIFRAYSGYIDVEARHLFFYFFESRRDPDADDVVFWTNGGPGASSSMGLFMELGASRGVTAGLLKANLTILNQARAARRARTRRRQTRGRGMSTRTCSS